MDELFEQFMIEGRELISKATTDLMALEEDVSARRRIDSAFRAVHTLKGSVAIFDLAPMGLALHAAEDLLGAVQAAVVPMDVSIAQALLGCLDECDRWMDAVQESGGLPSDAPREAVRISMGLRALTGLPQAPPAGGDAAEAAWIAALVRKHSARLEEARSAGRELVAIRYTPAEDCFFSGDDPVALVGAVPELLALDIRPRDDWPPLEEFDPYRCNLLIELLSSVDEPELRQLFRFVPDQVEIVPLASTDGQQDSADIAGGADAQRTIRVDSLQIDRLLNLLGELVVSKNRLTHLAALAEAGVEPKEIAAAIRATQAATDRLVGDMHRAVMSVRMVPLDRVFRRISRMVRDLSQRLDRQVVLEVRGEETRIDKAVADSLFEPLLHLVRNALDHGIEPSDARVAAGKEPSGRLSLAARSLGDQILIDVADDGAGIDPARIRAAAIERNMLPEETLQAMDDSQVTQLIFAPSFSTASSVTDVSGRGVGMDAVKSVVERLGGRVWIASRVGKGTTLSLRLPATAALTTVLVVRVGQERFAVPLETAVETLRVPRESIMPVGLGNAFVYRGRTLPLIELAGSLGVAAATSDGEANVLVVDGGQGRVGIAVDDFSERLEVMLRPMNGLLASVPGVSGTTLLGDGSVLLVLKLGEIIG